MRQRSLPGTDLQLSIVGFGAWAAGGLWWGDDVRDDEVVAAMRRAFDLGINWVDTAPLYGHGHADRLVVQALAGRKDIVVATKVGVRWDGEGSHARSDLSPAWLRADVDASLQRLGVACIDLLQIHWPDEAGVPLAESLGTLEDLRREGKFRHLGLSNYDGAGMQEASLHSRLASLQTPYSMLRREFEAELQPWCITHPLGVVAYEPLCRGLLTGKFTATHRFPESDLRQRDERFQGTRYLRALTLVSRLELIAKRLSVPTAALALGWALRQPGLTAVIAGAKRPAQVDAHARVTEVLEREEVWPDVDRIVASFRG